MQTDEGGSAGALVLQPLEVATTPEGEEGRMVMKDGRLVAVLVRLGAADGELSEGCWFLEAGFGPCQTAVPPIFASLDEATLWLSQQLQERRRA